MKMRAAGTKFFLSSLFLLCSWQTAPTSNQASDSIFYFHSSAWVNLHHYLYNEAFRSEKASQLMSGLDKSEKAQLARAIQFYQDYFKGRDLLFDDGLTNINTELSRVENQENINSSKIPEDLRKILQSFMPVYKCHLWQQQDRENQIWAENTKSLLRKYGIATQRDLEKVLDRKFSDGPYRFDIVHESNWSGAYTYSPPHTVISSGRPSYSNLSALEMVFHESLHAGPFDKVQSVIDQEFSKIHATDSDQLWHAILFFTAGEIVRKRFADDGIAYEPYAYKNGLFASDRKWGKCEPLLRKYWLPYLQGQGDMRSSISEFVKESTK